MKGYVKPSVPELKNLVTEADGLRNALRSLRKTVLVERVLEIMNEEKMIAFKRRNRFASEYDDILENGISVLIEDRNNRIFRCFLRKLTIDDRNQTDEDEPCDNVIVHVYSGNGENTDTCSIFDVIDVEKVISFIAENADFE